METLVAKLHALYVRAAGSVDSLQFRIVAAFAVIISLVLASTSYYTQYLAETDTVRFAEEQAAAREERLAGAVRSALVAAPGAPPADPALLPRLLDQAADLYGIDLVVVGPGGRVLGGDARLAPLASDAGADPDGLAVLSVPVASGEIVSVAYRPADAEGVIQEPRASSFVANIQWFLFIAGMTAGAVGLITFIWLSRRILVPLRSLTRAAERLGRGDLSQRVPVPRDVDLGRLGASFNAMAQQLQAAEQERRSMMADIAHELRTPLANIRGYVEAIQDGVIEADHETLATLHDQVGQLGRLIDDLRFVALVDAGALQLDLRPHDVGGLARAAADAIRPRAEAKGVAVETDIAPAPPSSTSTAPASRRPWRTSSTTPSATPPAAASFASPSARRTGRGRRARASS